jgi:inner membrane protein
MSPIAHAELAWLMLAQPLADRRNRALVTWAGVAPDVDGLTLLAYPFDHGRTYSNYHHLLFHSLPAALLTAGLCAALATRGARLATGGLAWIAFHLHLVCDLLGSGHEWPIAYLYPFGTGWIDPFSFGWELNALPNVVIALAATGAVLTLGVMWGRTTFEVLWPRGDAALCATLQRWAGRAPSTAPTRR